MAEIQEEQVVAEQPSLRKEDGEVRSEFVQQVARAIEANDAETLRTLTVDLHEADLGALIEALDQDLRPRLVELLGDDFDFAALTELDDRVRGDILEELATETVAEGVRDLESDDAVTILEYLDREDQEEILEALPAVDRLAIQRSLDYPENSAGRLMQTTLVR